MREPTPWGIVDKMLDEICSKDEDPAPRVALELAILDLVADSEKLAVERVGGGDLDLMAKQIHVLFGMVYANGRGLSSALDALGLDYAAACADPDDPEAAAVREWKLAWDAERFLDRDPDAD